jgi:hypothetical protein
MPLTDVCGKFPFVWVKVHWKVTAVESRDVDYSVIYSHKYDVQDPLKTHVRFVSWRE